MKYAIHFQLINPDFSSEKGTQRMYKNLVATVLLVSKTHTDIRTYTFLEKKSKAIKLYNVSKSAFVRLNSHCAPAYVFHYVPNLLYYVTQ